jgi:Uma2 family endonuclease
MTMSLAQEERRFTYQDYLGWPEPERWEIIGGKAYNMTPAPGTLHQRVLIRLAALLEKIGSPCIVFVAPTDVVLSEEDVVQPDLLIVCDQRKINPRNITGPPDLVVEITSPASVRKDRREKKDLYERFGVREYVIVDPEGKFAERWVLESPQCYGAGKIYSAEEELLLTVLERAIPLQEVFLF